MTTNKTVDPRYQQALKIIAENPSFELNGHELLDAFFELLQAQQEQVGRKLTFEEAMAIVYTELMLNEKFNKPATLTALLSHLFADVWSKR